MTEQGEAFGVSLGSGGDADIHALGFFDFVVVDFGEDQLILQPEGIVAASIEGLGLHAAEIANAGERDVHQAVEKFEHTVAAQGDHAADGHSFA